MEFAIVNDNAVSVTHQGVSLLYNVTQLKKSNLIVPGKDLFFEINQYISTLDQHTQYEIYKLYEDLRDLRDNDIGVSFNVQQKETTNIVTQLYKYLDIEKLALFTARANIVYPDGLISRSSEQASNLNINANINYYKEDYDGLIVLVIALRPMIPIWGEYVSINKEAVGTQYKEHRALKLLSKSTIDTSPYMERLRLYINEWRTTGNARNTLSDDIAVLDGISSDNITEYILGLILVRRLSICNVHANTEKDSIISSVYSYLKSKLGEAANIFKTSKKYDDGTGRESGEEMSILEKYKISSKLTHGDREFIKEYSRLPINVAKELDPTIDLFILEECLQHNHATGLSLNNHQRLMTQWTTYNAFPPQGVYELTKLEIINLVSVAQALLIHWGMYDLALIITSDIEEQSINVHVSTRVGMSEMLLTELNHRYPYQKITRRQSDKPNIAYSSIHKLNTELFTRMFVTNAPKTLASHLNIKSNKYSCPVNLVDQLAELLIKVDDINTKGDKHATLRN